MVLSHDLRWEYTRRSKKKINYSIYYCSWDGAWMLTILCIVRICNLILSFLESFLFCFGAFEWTGNSFGIKKISSRWQRRRSGLKSLTIKTEKTKIREANMQIKHGFVRIYCWWHLRRHWKVGLWTVSWLAREEFRGVKLNIFASAKIPILNKSRDARECLRRITKKLFKHRGFTWMHEYFSSKNHHLLPFVFSASL